MRAGMPYTVKGSNWSTGERFIFSPADVVDFSTMVKFVQAVAGDEWSARMLRVNG
jgi:hypothetical protein